MIATVDPTTDWDRSLNTEGATVTSSDILPGIGEREIEYIRELWCSVTERGIEVNYAVCEWYSSYNHTWCFCSCALDALDRCYAARSSTVVGIKRERDREEGNREGRKGGGRGEGRD